MTAFIDKCNSKKKTNKPNGMKIYFLFLSLLLITSTTACKEEPYLCGKITIRKDFTEKREIKGEIITLDNIYTGTMSVYDTLMLFSSSTFEDNNLLHIFNLNTGKELGSFCPQGRGPGEFLSLCYYHQFKEDSTGIKLWLGDILRERFMLFNVTQSLQAEEIAADATYSIEWRKKWNDPLAGLFVLDSNLILYKNLNEYLYNNKKEYDLGEYHLCKDSISNEIRQYKLFNRPLINGEGRLQARYVLSSMDRIKPDGTKIVMVMEKLKQINILDLKTGLLEGFRLENSLDFTDLKKSSDTKYFYTGVGVDNAFIYALYLDAYPNEIGEKETDKVHIYDWEGNSVCELILSHKISSLAIDPKHHILYGKNNYEDIYRYDLNPIIINFKHL